MNIRHRHWHLHLFRLRSAAGSNPGPLPVLLFVLPWIVAPPLRAETPTPISLAEALRRVETANPELAESRATVEAADARAEQVSRSRWPRLGLASDWSSSDNPVRVFGEKLSRGEFGASDFQLDALNDPAAISHLSTQLWVEAPIDLFGRAASVVAAERAAAGAAGSLARERQAEIRFAAVRAWYDASLGARAVEVAERAVAAARERERETEARVQEGAALSADLLRVRARRRSLEGELAARRGDAEVARVALGHVLGAAPDESFVPEGPVPTPAPLAESAEEWRERALAGRPVLSASAEASRAARAGAEAERKTVLPEVLLYGNYQDDRLNFSGGAQSYTVAAALRWNVFDAARTSRKVAAEASARSATERERAALAAVRLEVESAFRRAESARARHAAAAGGAEEGREALRVVRERRSAGMATLTDELETESAALAAELEEIRSAMAVLIADADLERAGGGAAAPSEETR